MGVTVDVTFKSLNKYSEILCGDTVECLKTEDSDVIILADGMGSGVKANILSTLTAKILGTMFLNGATLEECVETIVQTTAEALPDASDLSDETGGVCDVLDSPDFQQR